MSESIFWQIRSRCAEIAGRARWVRIDRKKLAGYAELLDLNASPPLAHTEEHHLLGCSDETLVYFLVLDTLNFGSGYFPYFTKKKGASGYFTVAKCLKDWFLQAGVPTAADLKNIDRSACAAIFQQDMSNLHADELMQLFALALNGLGDWIMTEYAGDTTGVFRRSETAAEVVAAVAKMPLFRDVATYAELQVPFLKRAQILVQDVVIAEPGHPALQYPDVNELTPFADNVLPYVLKADGILHYDPWLSGRIDREELIAPGSFEEVEVRACTIHALDILIKDINRSRDMTLRELDFHLWNRGQELKQLVKDRRHRTRCTFY